MAGVNGANWLDCYLTTLAAVPEPVTGLLGAGSGVGRGRPA
jgi:hypothetical protein